VLLRRKHSNVFTNQKVFNLRPMVEKIVSYLFSLGDYGSYFNSGPIVQNAINQASLQLYNQHKDKFGVDQASTDYISEFYIVTSQTVASPLTITPYTGNPGTERYVDVVKQIELLFADEPTTLRAVQILPDNQFTKMATNPVIGPSQEKPIGRLRSYLQYDILPSTYGGAIARTLVWPNDCEFTFTQNSTPIPTVNVIKDLEWTDEKVVKLAYMALVNLGAPVSSQILMQFGISQANATP